MLIDRYKFYCGWINIHLNPLSREDIFSSPLTGENLDYFYRSRERGVSPTLNNLDLL
jgi:hypothetical protein